MRTYTYLELKTKIKKDLDLEDETFIQEDELVGYFNEAIDNAEAEILTLFEDYFLTETTLSLVAGTSEYSLPSTIYANKIRGVIYHSGTVIYEVFPIRKLKKFIEIEAAREFGSADDYRYFIKTDSATLGYKMVLLPASRETSTNVKIFFIRNANRIPLVSEGTQSATDATQVDIPEFYTFILQFVKVAIMGKEGDPRYGDNVQRLQAERQMMVDSLSKLVIDDNDTIDLDLSFYRGHS